jgi:uncharacterized protein (TIGR03435 family)
LLRAIAGILLIAATASAQNTPPAAGAYDLISTVKPSHSADAHLRIRMDKDAIYIEDASVRDLLSNIYGIRTALIFNLPKWAESDHFDIRAKVLSDDPNFLRNIKGAQRREIFERLLADRFDVQSHRETRTLPVYELTRVGPGPQLVENPPPSAGSPPEPLKPGHNGRGSTSVNGTTLDATGVRIGDLCANLGRILDRNVVDKTGLTGFYDITLKWQDSPSPSESGSQESISPSLFTALQEQLGLKLNSAKGPVDVLIVDRATPPEEN